MDKPTLKSLQEKAWYRFLKAIYFITLSFGILIILLSSLLYGIGEGVIDSMLIFLLFLIFITEAPRRILYYTLLGTIFPKE